MKLPEGKFHAYIFDCDGTLADTMPLHYQAWCKALSAIGCDFPEPLFYELGGVPARTIIEMLNARHGCSMPVEETAERKEQIFVDMITLIEPIEPVVALVKQLHGTAPMAVASGGLKHIVMKTLNALNLAEKFQAIVTSEDYVHGKPAPDPFLEAARQLGVEPTRCLVFEDTPTGIEAARAAGMQWVLVPPPERAG